jgi:alkylation response protein AidB-like acyl-CoA dehydrogenase
VFFTDVHVPVDCRLGAENEGWPLIRRVLANERIGAARFERASRVISAGVSGTATGVPAEPVAAGQALAACQAARMLAYAAVQDRIDGKDDTGSASTSRVASIAAERAATQVLVSEYGEESELAGSPADDQFTVSMPVSITAGTLEVQLDLVARLALRLPRE